MCRLCFAVPNRYICGLLRRKIFVRSRKIWTVQELFLEIKYPMSVTFIFLSFLFPFSLFPRLVRFAWRWIASGCPVSGSCTISGIWCLCGVDARRSATVAVTYGFHWGQPWFGCDRRGYFAEVNKQWALVSSYEWNLFISGYRCNIGKFLPSDFCAPSFSKTCWL